MNNGNNPTFYQQLLELPYIDVVALESIHGRHKDNHFELMIELIERNIAPKQTLCELWGNTIGVSFVDPLQSPISVTNDEQLPKEIVEKAKAVCLYRIGEFITVAMADPTNQRLVASLEKILDASISPVFSLPKDILTAFELQHNDHATFDDALSKVLDKTREYLDFDETDPKSMEFVRSENLIEFFDAIVYRAFRERASDIHMEADDLVCRLRFRVDGHMRLIRKIPKPLYEALLVRLKVLSNMNIAEKRLPQDGRFTINIGTFKPSFRVNVLPGLHGEKAVIRILGLTGKQSIVELDKMVIARPIRKTLERILSAPNGIFIVTGPTGSGKTTTLYASLNHMKSPKNNVVTIEDPVEYQLEGINHFQVNAEIGLTFANILRATLRQDPDIILVGEIRDLETAKIATEAALTGHFVLTSLHTNNAIQAILRLVEIGVDPYLVAPSTMGVLSQRLVGRNCERCKQAYYPSDEFLSRFFTPESISRVEFYRGDGCPACSQTGYSGRLAVHELVEVTEEIRALIAANASLGELMDASRRAGYRSMRYDGLKKVLLGLTSIEEIERSTLPEYYY